MVLTRTPLALTVAALLVACAGKQRAGATGPPSAAPAVAGAPAVPALPPDPEALKRARLARARELFAAGVEKVAAGRHADAAADFEEAFRLDGDLVWAEFDAGVAREAAGEDDRAIEAYRAVLAASPEHAPTRRNLLRLRVRLGKGDEVERELRAALEKEPEQRELRGELLEALVGAGKLDAAEAEARRTLRSDERNVRAMVGLATVYHARKRHELALMVLENARQIDAKDATVWNRRGFVELALGNRAQALEAWKTAAELAPDYAEAQVNHGAMLVETEDFPGAVKALEAAVRAAPRSKEAWLDLGNAYRGARRFDDAQRSYERTLALDPALADAQYDLALLHLDGGKQGLATAERLEKAIAFLDAYAAAGGKEPKVAQYRKDATTQLEKEKRRLAREEKDELRKEADARKKGEAAKKEADAAAATAPLPDPPPASGGRGEPPTPTPTATQKDEK